MATQNNPKTIYLNDYQVADFIIEAVHLHVDLHEDETQVRSILHLQRNPDARVPNAALCLAGKDLQLKAVLLNGKVLAPAAYRVDGNSLTIASVPDDIFTLETRVVIKPQENKTLSGLYQSRHNFCTQCEAEGFRHITYFLDRPDVMTRFTTTITADKTKYPFLLSNGNLVEEKLLPDNRHLVRWEDPSLKPCYLFALVAGDFDLLQDCFLTRSGRSVDLRLYVEKGFADQGHYALQALKNAMRWDEEKYGREYDLDIYMIVAVSDFNMGAMENKGLNIFNTVYVLAKPETATDGDYIAIENVIGHEYFHNWTGNRITCRDWFQLTLKEGLTVFRDQAFTADMTSAGVKRIDSVNILRDHQFPEDAGPMAHPIRPQSYIEINNFYTNTVYRKGSEVIRMIQTLIGEKKFRQGMDIYFKRHDGQAVTTEDFVQAMADASGRDFSQFKRWYDQAGTPIVDVTSHYDATQKTYALTVKQHCPATPGQQQKKPFHLPLAIGLVSSQCTDMPTQLQSEAKPLAGTRILEITQPEETFTFINVLEKPVPSLLRNFSAPVQLNYAYTDRELLWLLQCDSDAFSRYEAGQEYIERLIFKLAEQHLARVALQKDAELIEAVRKIITNVNQDPLYLARLLQLPSFSYLIQRKNAADIESIHVAREFVKKMLATELADLWLQIYTENSGGAYQYTMQEVGRRAIKNLALSYLTFSNNKDAFHKAYSQYQNSDNMTDRMGALLALNDHDVVERKKVLEEFYEQWKDQPLVVNKWFAVQASSTLANTLAVVKQLTKHPGFDRLNPNNVYSLINAFVTNNILRFHDESGEAYKFLADQVLLVDPVNPQVAARILQALTRWRQFDEKRQALMKKELQRILAADKLSNDVYELCSKSLLTE